MHSLASDNTAPIAPEILRALYEANEGSAPSYATDRFTSYAREAFSELFKREVHVVFTSTGTAANALALATLCPPWKRVLCQRWSHVMESEAGAPEALGGGQKLSAPANGSPKLTAADVAHECMRYKIGDPHSACFGAISIAQATEVGTVYSLSELEALGTAATAHNVALHIDGARIANALVSLDCTAAQLVGSANVDALSFGIAKNGGAFGDAIILFDLAKAEELRFRQMRAGHLMAKNRYVAAQAIAYLRDDLWLRYAARANSVALVLERRIRDRGWSTAAPVDANLVFAIMPRAAVDRLQRAGVAVNLAPPARFGMEADELGGSLIVRFVTSWQTRQNEIDSLWRELD